MSENPVISTSSGQVRGRVEDGVRSFLGVPYAAPPFGANRLREPVPHEPWTGIRPADRMGATPPKSRYPAAAQALFPEPVVEGEDCLNLNVWAPEGASDLPVLVWIYGGSFQMGSNAVPEYDGTAFARDGVVTVVPNYRLGVEGFAELDGAPTNRALRDLVAALQWVRDEITAFGGNPARVTIGGESAGAAMIAALLAVPEARGLFAAAAMQSGPYEAFLSKEQGDAVARALADRLDVEPTRDAFALIEADRLVAVGDELVVSISREPERWGPMVVTGRPLIPVVDGEYFAGLPIGRAAESADVPVLLGTDRDEYRLFLPLAVPPGTLDEAGLLTWAHRCGLDEDGVRDYLDAAEPGATPWDVLAAVIGDQRFAVPAIRYADARHAAGGTTWMWRFDGIQQEDNGGLGSAHATDVPFIFATADLPALESRIGASPSRSAISAVHDTWVRFIVHHKPGWPVYEPVRRTTALVADTIEIVDDPRATERRAWGREPESRHR